MAIQISRNTIIPAIMQMRHIAPKVAAAAGDWWDPNSESLSVVAAYQPKGAASYAASLVNLANPGTYDAFEGTAPDWASGTGWTFDGSNSEFLRTLIVPTLDQTWSMIVQLSGVTANSAYQQACGIWNPSVAADRFAVSPNFGGDNRLYFHCNAKNIAGRVTNGGMAIAGRQPYLNGSADGDPVAVGSYANTYSINIGAASKTVDGTQCHVGSYLYGTIVAVAFYSATLTAGQVAAVYAAMAAL